MIIRMSTMTSCINVSVTVANLLHAKNPFSLHLTINTDMHSLKGSNNLLTAITNDIIPFH